MFLYYFIFLFIYCFFAFSSASCNVASLVKRSATDERLIPFITTTHETK